MSLLLLALLMSATSQYRVINSPDGKLQVYMACHNGKPSFSIRYQEKCLLEESPLGLITNISDFSRGLTLVETSEKTIRHSYQDRKLKTRRVEYLANEATFLFETAQKERLDIVFRVSNNNVAFRYMLAQNGETARCIVTEELSGFNFPSHTTTFLTPQAPPMTGWMRTKPSYEEEYVADEPVGTPSKYGIGYTFPGLFHLGDDGWVLLSETGVDSRYCGARLSEGSSDGLYSVAYPEAGENNGIGSSNPAIPLPGETPWRTITVGDNLKPIVETTIATDLVEPRYQPSRDYSFGRSTWSWLLWQDGSINYDDQKRFIDLSAEMGYELVLIDNWWDSRIGHDKIETLADYAASRQVGICLWYNSNGYWSDAPQGPKNRMNNAVARKKEMAWMQRIGVKGIKVDFFGGDKQQTMQLYEEILSDANDYGLTVIFHGCTLPRGWERMYPNFAGSEAVLASENLIFTQHANDHEAYNATLHPFIRNSVASMDFGPVLLNRQHNRTNDGGTNRRTTETFQLATAVLFQSPIQNFGLTPNNLTEQPSFVINFMKQIPTLWDETVFIDGYPGRYVVLARRYGDRWFVAAVNALKEVKQMTLRLPMLAGKEITLYSDKDDRTPQIHRHRVPENGDLMVTIQPDGALIATNE